MEYGISISASNHFSKVLCFKDEIELATGITTIEADTAPNGENVWLYIQNKGFGKSKSKSITAKLDNKTISELIVFLQRHLELSEKVEAMRNAAA